MILRSIAPLFLLSAACAAQASEMLSCEGRPTGFGSADLVCPMRPVASASGFKFAMRFSGVHDDSSAALALAVRGKPLACADGSTSRIAGDAAGSSLECRFALDSEAAGASELTVHLLWYHAEPVGYELARD